ncbi:MAG TPA: AAA family ATPase [Propionibacteriaceae bacterium]|jgi:dephospho-CoA kinase|nr:AAA family ATPase [Propionibacteriaceae bacterium]
MTAVLITGMSGVGKSTVLAELAQRGHRVVDCDDEAWSEQVPTADGSGTEQLWREDVVAQLLAEPRAGYLFLAGCAANQVRFYDRFAAVVLLSAPREVLLSRIETRSTNPFGKDERERARILTDLQDVEPLLRRSATVEISTDRPLTQVVTAVEAASDLSTAGDGSGLAPV